MSDTIFPRCMREGKKIDVNMWSLAEAVLAESDGKLVGRRGIKALSEDFQNLCGLDYSTSWLNDLRFVAQQFPRSRRYDGEHNKPIVSVKAHLAAEDKGLAKGARKELGDRIGYLSENQAALLHEVAMEAAEAWRKLAQDIQSSTDKKSSHLS